MKKQNGYCLFGFIEGMVYGDCHETFDEFRTYKNNLAKSDVIRHIESLNPAYTSIHAKDLFSGEDIGNAGLYDDGRFLFPIDFLRYYKTMDIGIPPEYEEYLVDEIGLKP